MNKLATITSILIRSRVLQHILFWMLSGYLLLRVFADPGEYPKVDIIYTALFHLTLWVAVYPNLLILIPRLLQKERYLLYALSLCILILGGVFFNILFFDKLVDFVFPGYYFISYYEFIDILQFFLAYVVITSLIKLSRSWFQILEKEKELAQLSEEKKVAELKALKAQVNPHFLFNNLNNIYGQALQNSPQTSEMVMKLSNVLRYMIYEVDKERVALSDELTYLNDYLELEKMRNEYLKINFEIQGSPTSIQVAPLLFIPFIENAFKYSKKEKGSVVEIRFDLRNSAVVSFRISNETDPGQISGFGGVGIENVRKRLQLQYPETHELTITNRDRFTVELNLYES